MSKKRSVLTRGPFTDGTSVQLLDASLMGGATEVDRLGVGKGATSTGPFFGRLPGSFRPCSKAMPALAT